jgi:hypothetical protein
MKNVLIFILFIVPFFLNAQNLVLPKDAKDKLKGIKPNGTQSPDTSASSQKVSEDLLHKFWQVRIEYSLEYESGDEIVSLGKDGNDFFGFDIVYGVSADNMLWLDKKQLQPWLKDGEYQLYKADTLTPAVTRISAHKVGKTSFIEIHPASSDIKILNDNLSVYELPENNPSFNITQSGQEEGIWLLMFQKDDSNIGTKPEVSLISIANADKTVVESLIETYKSAGKEFSNGVVFNSDANYENSYLNYLIIINRDSVLMEEVVYKKSLNVIKTIEKSDVIPDKICCCDDLETVKDKSKRKRIIKKWQSELKKAKKRYSKMEEGASKEELELQIKECASKIKYYK